MQPNLSQRTKSCQIRADSYRSISSTQTCQLHGGRDYVKGEGDSPISRLWGSLWQRLAYQTCSDVSLPMHQKWQQNHIYIFVFQILAHQQQLLASFKERQRHGIKLATITDNQFPTKANSHLYGYYKCIISNKYSLNTIRFDLQTIFKRQTIYSKSSLIEKPKNCQYKAKIFSLKTHTKNIIWMHFMLSKNKADICPF